MHPLLFQPWLHHYDDYFIVNAQGVFGFINTHRTVLVLSYTHDDLTAKLKTNRDCRDRSGPIVHSSGGQPLECGQLAPHCGDRQFGKQIRSACPKSCGMCRSVSLGEGVTWHPLDFKNLPVLCVLVPSVAPSLFTTVCFVSFVAGLLLSCLSHVLLLPLMLHLLFLIAPWLLLR